MNIKQILIAGLIGGAVAFLLGFLIFGVLLSDFFENNAGSASGVMKGDAEMLWIPMILGHLAIGMLLAVIYVRWANISTFITGAKAGAVIGFLISCAEDLIDFGSMNLMNITAVIVNIVAVTIITAIVGGVIGMVLGRNAGK